MENRERRPPGRPWGVRLDVCGRGAAPGRWSRPAPALSPPSLLPLVFQEVLPAAGGAAGSEDVQCAGSTINPQDLL